MQNFNRFVLFKELYEKPAFLKIEAKTFDAGDFLNIFVRFRVFEAYFLIKILLKKRVIISQIEFCEFLKHL